MSALFKIVLVQTNLFLYSSDEVRTKLQNTLYYDTSAAKFINKTTWCIHQSSLQLRAWNNPRNHNFNENEHFVIYFTVVKPKNTKHREFIKYPCISTFSLHFVTYKESTTNKWFLKWFEDETTLLLPTISWDWIVIFWNNMRFSRISINWRINFNSNNWSHLFFQSYEIYYKKRSLSNGWKIIEKVMRKQKIKLFVIWTIICPGEFFEVLTASFPLYNMLLSTTSRSTSFPTKQRILRWHYGFRTWCGLSQSVDWGRFSWQ